MSAEPESLRPAPAGTGPARVPRAHTAAALVRATRPRQALKNVLVLAAPAAAGKLTDAAVLPEVLGAFAAFWACAAGLYLLNDVRDAARDRHHPVKAARPVASGRLDAGLATRAGIALIALGLVVALLVGPGFALLVAGYVAITAAYIVWLRDVPVLDLAAVASGFYLRAAGGAVAIGVPVSRWFAIVACFGSLLLVAGKRQGERMAAGTAPSPARPVLARYSVAYLRQVVLVSAGVTIAAYCLWAFERADTGPGMAFELTIVPFVLFMLRYLMLVDEGRAEEPESLIVADRGLLAAAALWCVLFGAAVTLA